VISYITTAVAQGAAKVSGWLFHCSVDVRPFIDSRVRIRFFCDGGGTSFEATRRRALDALRCKGNKSLLPGLKGTRTCSCCHRRWASEISDLNIADAKGVGVAAKLLLQKADQSAEELALLQEAAFLADLRHRSIVSLFGLRAQRFAFVSGEESSQ
jgi:hypothetical protein